MIRGAHRNRCPNCQERIGGSIPLLQCRKCEGLFCQSCQGRTIFSAMCPHCGGVEIHPAGSLDGDDGKPDDQRLSRWGRKKRKRGG